MAEPKITQYGICSALHHEQLAGFVNEQIKEGFQPYGHPFTTVQPVDGLKDADQLFFHQAMVKAGPVKKKKA